MKKKKIFGRKTGYTLIECLIALMVLCLASSIYFTAMKKIKNLTINTDRIQDVNGIHQLALSLALATDMEVSSDQITYYYKDESFMISLVNEKLMIQPGTNILLLNIDAIEFFQEDEQVILIYRRDDKEMRRVVYY